MTEHTYTIMGIDKIKSSGALSSKYNHNKRIAEVENADPGQRDSNETLIDNLTKDGKEQNYAEAFNERINSLPYYQEHKIRPGQVEEFEVMLSYTKNDNIDVEEWKKQTVQWLKDTFNVAGDGRDNVISVEYHGDESAPHIHAMVIPIDERGHLNAKRFTNGARAMRDLQTSYAKAVKSLGIERGLEKSSATHKDIQKLYAEIDKAKELPEPEKGENAEEYRDRVRDDLETKSIASKKEIDDYRTEAIRNTDKYRNQQKEELDNEAERIHNSLARDVEELQNKRDSFNKEITQNKEQIEDYQKQLELLNDQLLKMQNKTWDEKEKERTRGEKANKYDDIMNGCEVIKAEDPERGKNILSEMEYATTRSGEIDKIKDNRERDMNI